MTDKQFGKMIQARRIYCWGRGRTSLKYAGEAVGLSWRIVQMVERGEYNPLPFSWAQKFAKALGIIFRIEKPF